VLRLAGQLVDGIQQGLAQRGFTDVRPVHGFAFARLSGEPATTAQLADHLGITKQATSELVQHLVERGYVTRTSDPSDLRARLLVLTDRGHACTRAAEQAAADTVDSWKHELTPRQFAELQRAVAAIAGPGRLRPAW
jgi:DNA-binding MarR family transcriptional regulator